MKKPDGYCVWRKASNSFDIETAADYLDSDGEPDDQGDRVLPVHIIDASEASEFVVVPRKLVEWVETLRKALYRLDTGELYSLYYELNEIFPEAKADE